MGHLGELATLVRVEVDVVDVERRRNKVRRIDTVANDVRVGVHWGVVPHEVLEVVELKVDADLVILESDQGESKARVAAEPELEGHVERVLRGTAEELA